MADVVYSTDPLMGLYQDHSDIRREAANYASDIRREGAEHTNEIVKETIKSEAHILQDAGKNTNEIVREGLKESFNIRGDVKDSRHDINRRINEATSDLSRQVDAIDDTFTKQASDYFIANQQYAFNAARDLASIKATSDMAFMKLGQDIQTQGALGQAASALESAKVAAAIALGQSQLSKEIFADGQKTRDLVNDLKYHDLNRALIERNSELVEEREGRRHWRHHADQNQWAGQFAALQSQMQNFNSQLSETRQGMVNFGTMAGVGQTSTSTNVK
jgi:hypothetical protein